MATDRLLSFLQKDSRVSSDIPDPNHFVAASVREQTRRRDAAKLHVSMKWRRHVSGGSSGTSVAIKRRLYARDLFPHFLHSRLKRVHTAFRSIRKSYGGSVMVILPSRKSPAPKGGTGLPELRTRPRQQSWAQLASSARRLDRRADALRTSSARRSSDRGSSPSTCRCSQAPHRLH
jgi:hypothetical protein